MSRIGTNPARAKQSSYSPARVTVAILVYIPHLEGYFSERLDILELVFHSILSNTSEKFDLLVFNNGSCKEALEFLEDQYNRRNIDFLIHSRKNIGKISALKIITQAAPGEIIAYTDDDVYFHKDWLKSQLAVLDSDPRIGLVSGVPVFDASSRFKTAFLKYKENLPQNCSVNSMPIPEEWERDWAISTGRDVKLHLEEIGNREVDHITFEGISAFVTANHFQFITHKDVLLQALPTNWGRQLMGQMHELDVAIDKLGYLRLSTVDRYVQHLGNVLTEDFLTDTDGTIDSVKERRQRSKHWILAIPGMGRALWKVYHWLFRLLNRIGD